MKKRLLILVILILLSGILPSGCNTTNNYNPLPDKHLRDYIKIENMIGCTIKYNNNCLMSPYRITPIPLTQLQYQQYKMINSKLGKYYEAVTK